MEKSCHPKTKDNGSYKYLNPIFWKRCEDADQAAESIDVSCMDNLGENPGNESYPESEVSNISGD